MAERSFETLLYEESGGVAWVTLNRPDVHNAFNAAMQHELRDLWRALRRDDDVRCVVLTGAGDKAFCTGIDRTETMGSDDGEQATARDGVGAPSPGGGGVQGTRREKNTEQGERI